MYFESLLQALHTVALILCTSKLAIGWLMLAGSRIASLQFGDCTTQYGVVNVPSYHSPSLFSAMSVATREINLLFFNHPHIHIHSQVQGWYVWWLCFFLCSVHFLGDFSCYLELALIFSVVIQINSTMQWRVCCSFVASVVSSLYIQ